MPIDVNLTLIPATLDAVHVALAGLASLLLLLSLLLTVVTLAALRRKPKAAEPLPVTPPVATPPPPKPAPPARVEPPRPVVVREASPDAALQLLGLLQQEARFIDFLQENIANHGDADIGAAVRVVHEGCRKVLQQHLDVEPIRTEAESSRITLPKGYDAQAVRVSGNIVGEPPFTGTLIHRGWRAARITLPKLAEGHDAHVLAPAEVEL